MGIILQAIGSILLVWGYIPQILQLLNTRKSEDISTSFWVILSLGLFCILCNMIISGVGVAIIFTQTVNVALAFITLILVRRYK